MSVRFTLALQDIGDGDAPVERRLARALKCLLRSFQFKCVEAIEMNELPKKERDPLRQEISQQLDAIIDLAQVIRTQSEDEYTDTLDLARAAVRLAALGDELDAVAESLAGDQVIAFNAQP